ncbi:MAG: hypothetical protein IMZ53_00405 [Thermoplasmata archaeon]|nr:hypothetical protein [Thermoplasmata archaeon]
MELTLSLVAIAILIGWWLFVFGQIIGYKYGQIDALTGKVKYQLVTNPDSTRVWMEIKK